MGGGYSRAELARELASQRSQLHDSYRSEMSKRDSQISQLQQRMSEENHKFWNSTVWDNMKSLLYSACCYFAALGLIAFLAWAVVQAFWYWRDQEKQKKQQEFQDLKLQQEAVLREKEMKQQAELKAKELEHQAQLKDRELALKQKELELKQFSEARKYRLDVGKMYLDMCKTATENGVQWDPHALSGALTDITHMMITADSPGSSPIPINISAMPVVNPHADPQCSEANLSRRAPVLQASPPPASRCGSGASSASTQGFRRVGKKGPRSSTSHVE
eukprot:TRINITY_DN21011_c0_g1_i1.p1 TRINITY_DN21011_c0_g1~~TRINITY_DN21011_c0_g1_i1.p1  ORF type:complete len:276 (+),score=53.38 TRINITY_DN21011_c0_g1_i1:71-898(+)